tara:strand:- start:154 stop:1263 length:1110 start_codon:yes stop_codon:yes gene_type:complete
MSSNREDPSIFVIDNNIQRTDPDIIPVLRQSKVKELHIPSSVRVIGANSFKNHFFLTRVIFEDGVEDIEECAFAGCHIKTVIFPRTLRRICKGAFSGCEIKQIHLHPGIEIIEEGAFKGCMVLREIVLPDTIQRLHRNAFKFCHPSTTISFGEVEDIQLVQGLLPQQLACEAVGPLQIGPEGSIVVSCRWERQQIQHQKVLVSSSGIVEPLLFATLGGEEYYLEEWSGHDNDNLPLVQLLCRQHPYLLSENGKIQLKLKLECEEEASEFITPLHIAQLMCEGRLDIRTPILVVFDNEVNIKLDPLAIVPYDGNNSPAPSLSSQWRNSSNLYANRNNYARGHPQGLGLRKKRRSSKKKKKGKRKNSPKKK